MTSDTIILASDGFLSKADFDNGIRHLDILSQRLKPGSVWQDVHIISYHDDTGLRIKAQVKLRPHKTEIQGSTPSNSEALEIDDEEDAERLDEQQIARHDERSFDIIHSPTYQVPILYVYGSLDPPAPSSAFQDRHNDDQDRGIVSFADHPWYNIPVHFVHPCRTADMMRARLCNSGSTQALTPAQYLIAWLGFIGQPLGLSVPVELAEVLASTTTTTADASDAQEVM